MKPQRAVLIAIVICLSAFTATGQGLYVESRTGTDDAVEKFWYMPHMFRTTEDDGKITIIRLDREVVYNIDPENRTYTEFHFSEMKGMKDKAAAMLERSMKNMSPEQRKAMEEMQKHLGKASPEQKKAIKYQVVNTGEKRSIAGYNCVRYIVKRSGDETETIWATNEIRGTESLRRDIERFMEKLSIDLGSGEIGSEWYKEIRGFPVQTESDGSTKTVTRIDQRAINSSEFEVPSGYTKEKREGLDDPDQDEE